MIGIAGTLNGFKVVPSWWIPKGQIVFDKNNFTLFISQHDIYKLIFIDGKVTQEHIDIAINIGIERVNNFIDNLNY
jgi:hypothetical protein